MENIIQQEYNTFQALKMTTQGKKMRCLSFGSNCGFILEFDGKGYHFNSQSEYADIETELDFNAKWIEDY